MRKRDDFGRVIVALDTPHDAIALVVKPPGGEHRVGLARRGIVNLFQGANQFVESPLARTADVEMTIVAREHARFHQLVVAQVCGRMCIKSHCGALPWPCAVCGSRGTDEPGRWSR